MATYTPLERPKQPTTQPAIPPPSIQPPVQAIQPIATVGGVKPSVPLPVGGGTGTINSGTKPTIPYPATPTAPGGFGPDNNLIGQQIDPVAFAPGADTTGARSAVTGGLQSLQSTPNRRDLALDALKLFDEETADTRRLGTQAIGRDAARLGRLGSGMVTTDLGNLEERLQLGREREKRRLAGETAGLELDDQLKRLGGAQSVFDQLYGADVTGAGLAERGRNELRGERGYQYGLDRTALEDRIREAQLGNQFANDELQRQLGYGGLVGGYGYAATSPTYQSLINQYGNRSAASGDAAADLLYALGRR